MAVECHSVLTYFHKCLFQRWCDIGKLIDSDAIRKGDFTDALCLQILNFNLASLLGYDARTI